MSAPLWRSCSGEALPRATAIAIRRPATPAAAIARGQRADVAGAVTLGGEQGRFDTSTGKLTLGSDDYTPLAIPKPGTR